MPEYKIGDIVEGTAIELRPYGAIVLFDNNRLGLLHISEISFSFIKNIKKFMHVGRTYQVKIIDIADDGFLKVSMNKISDAEKEQYRNKREKRVEIDPSTIDFTALNEHLKTWIEEAKEG